MKLYTPAGVIVLHLILCYSWVTPNYDDTLILLNKNKLGQVFVKFFFSYCSV